VTLYPPGALLAFHQPHEREQSLHQLLSGLGQLAPNHTAAAMRQPAGVFAFDCPPRASAPAAAPAAALQPDLSSSRPIFARGAGSVHFRPGPTWGTVEYRNQCRGDDGSPTAVESPPLSRGEVWHAAAAAYEAARTPAQLEWG